MEIFCDKCGRKYIVMRHGYYVFCRTCGQYLTVPDADKAVGGFEAVM